MPRGHSTVKKSVAARFPMEPQEWAQSYQSGVVGVRDQEVHAGCAHRARQHLDPYPDDAQTG